MNLIEEGLKVQQMIVDANKEKSNVIAFPTDADVAKVKAQGKRVVHRPDYDDTPPEAA